MRHSYTKQFLTALCAASLLLLASGAQAATVELEGETAVGISNLEVDGVLYNITFTFGTWPDVYGVPPDFDVTPETASLFTEEINKVLTLWPIQPRAVGESGAVIDTRIYYIGTEVEAADLVAWTGGFYVDDVATGGWFSELDEGQIGGFKNRDQVAMWTNISVVPAPPAVWLFGSALGLLGWVRRNYS